MRLSRIQLRFRLLTPNVVNPTKQQQGESPRPTAGPRAKTRSKSGLTVFDLAHSCATSLRGNAKLCAVTLLSGFTPPHPTHTDTRALLLYLAAFIGVAKKCQARAELP